MLFTGKVSKLRLLGDYQHATRIAFVEFEHADGAMAALNCSGVLLGAYNAIGCRPSTVLQLQLVCIHVWLLRLRFWLA